MICWRSYYQHDDVNKWKHFPRYWPFVRGIHRSPVNFLHKSQWRRALMFSLICTWINSWVNYREAGYLWRHRAHYDVIVMKSLQRSSDPREIIQTMLLSWWRHGTDAFSALLTICTGNPNGKPPVISLTKIGWCRALCCHWHQPCMIKYSYTSYQNLVRWPVMSGDVQPSNAASVCRDFTGTGALFHPMLRQSSDAIVKCGSFINPQSRLEILFLRSDYCILAMW